MPSIALRAVSSAFVCWLLSLWLLKSRRGGAVIKDELLQTQRPKQGTPVVGGIAFSLATITVSLLDPHLFEPAFYIPLVTLIIFAITGLIDDRAKARLISSDGLTSLTKLLLQSLGAVTVLSLMAQAGFVDTSLAIGPYTLALGPWYWILAFCYLLFFVNAVNITDGLDTLAAGSSIPLLLLISAIAIRRGSQPPASLLGALTVFLFFNAHPARYFMGDVGSHALGSSIAVYALLFKVEVMLLVAAGLFLVELATSLIQIISIRRFGYKVFTIAPLHHAYELKGLGERTIVRRFVMASWVCGALSLILLW